MLIIININIRYSGHDIRFNTHSVFSINGELGKKADSFDGNKCLSRHTDYRKKDILVLCKGTTDVLDNTRITAETKNYINIIKSRTKICLSLHYNITNSFSCVNGVKIH